MIVYVLAYRYRNKYYGPKHPWRKYFIPALTVKVFGAVFIGMIYQYYYGGGDTFEFFRHAKIINSAFSESFGKGLKLLFRIPAFNDGEYYQYIIQMQWYGDSASYTISGITAFINLFTFRTYLPTAVVFAGISFTGVWALFRTFAEQFPNLIKPIAVAVLFIPSTFVWGSGIFKDTICLFALGWFTYGTFRMLAKRDFSLKNILLTSFSFLLISRIKIYILVAFIPAFFLWILFIYTKKIKNVGTRIFVNILAIGFIFFLFLVLANQFSAELGSYSLDNIAKTSNVTRNWIGYASERDEGSSYDLGDFDPSIQGMLQKFPAAVNVTLFRPYIWEVNKVIVLLSAIEAFLFLFITLKLLFVIGPKKIWRTIRKEPAVQFCLVFSVIFAFAVGISSYNFGALSRYKIPCLSFYVLFVILTFYFNEKSGKKLLSVIGL